MLNLIKSIDQIGSTNEIHLYVINVMDSMSLSSLIELTNPIMLSHLLDLMDSSQST